MKKYFLLGLIFITAFCNAQKVEIGIAGGYSRVSTIRNHYGDFYIGNPYYGNFSTFTFGVRVTHKTNKYFDLRTGLYLTQKGFKYHDKNIIWDEYPVHPQYVRTNISVPSYLDIPILISIHATKKIDLFLGTGYSLNVSRNTKSANSYFDIPMNIGFTFHQKAMSLDCMYSVGTIPYAIGTDGPNNNYLFTNNQFTAVIGFAINQKKIKK